MARLLAVLRLQLLPLALYAVLLATTASAGQTCYHANGQIDSMVSNTPCDTNSTFSACCNFQNSDVCLSSGLCLNTGTTQQSHLLWATGCTDPTFQDKSCPQLCTGGKFYNPRLQFCNDTHVCCNDDTDNMNTTTCCSSAFKLGRVGTAIAQLSPLDSSASSSAVSSAPISSTATSVPSCTGNGSAAASQTAGTQSSAPSGGFIAGIAVLAVALALSLVALGLLVWRNKTLTTQLNAEQQAQEPPSQSPTSTWVPYHHQQWQHYQNTGTTSVSSQAAPNVPPREPPKAELYSPYQTSELVGSA